MIDLSQQILRTDVAGMPLEWVDYRDAVRRYFLGQVAYSCGQVVFCIHGGVNARSHQRSRIEVNAIIATQGCGHLSGRTQSDYAPPVNNAALFRRDGLMCLYCGQRFPTDQLSRDHVRPLSQGGADHWNNLVTACIRCNNHKAGRTPEAAGMELLAIPFAPTHAEYVYLQGHHVLADQMEFLRAHFPRTSPLHRHLDSA